MVLAGVARTINIGRKSRRPYTSTSFQNAGLWSSAFSTYVYGPGRGGQDHKIEDDFAFDVMVTSFVGTAAGRWPVPLAWL